VTGGAGFIGSHLTARLVALGHDVRVVDNLSTGDEANLAGVAGDIEFLRSDLCEVDVCSRAVSGIDVVFHVAAFATIPNPYGDGRAGQRIVDLIAHRLRGAPLRMREWDGPGGEAVPPPVLQEGSI